MKPMGTAPKTGIKTNDVQDVLDEKRGERKDRRWKIKLLTISVIAVVVIVAAAVTIAFYLGGKTSEPLLKTALVTFRDETGETRTEKVTISPTEKKYEIPGSDKAIFDFGKGLLVYRMERLPKPVCFVTAYNTSNIDSPDNIMAVTSDNMEAQNSSETRILADFMNTNIIVPSKDFLSPLSKEMCSDTDLMWMVPKSGCVERSASRTKRLVDITITIKVGWWTITIRIQF